MINPITCSCCWIIVTFKCNQMWCMHICLAQPLKLQVLWIKKKRQITWLAWIQRHLKMFMCLNKLIPYLIFYNQRSWMLRCWWCRPRTAGVHLSFNTSDALCFLLKKKKIHYFTVTFIMLSASYGRFPLLSWFEVVLYLFPWIA